MEDISLVRAFLARGSLTLALLFTFHLTTPARAASAADSDSLSAADGPVVAAHSAYGTAWKQRTDGHYADAMKTADEALLQIQSALADNPDATTRLNLVEMQSKITGLRDLASSEFRSHTKVEPGNEADARVLNAPAMDAIEPQYNEQVYRWIEFFTGSGRSAYERWLKRSGRYVELFRTVLQKEGLPPDLVHLVFVESGFNIDARSVSAAVGPWQFLRSTGRLFGLNINQWVDERKDPEKSTVAAARYLKHLYSIFGDWPLALASYNAGEGTVLRAIKQQGTTNYWDLKLPRQTEEYVPQFMAVLAISRDPEKYGFEDVARDDPMQFDEIAFKGAVDLRVLAKLCECDYDEMRRLNPAVLRTATTGPNGVTVLRVPEGKGPVLMERLQSGSAMPAVNLTLTHRVRSGETINSIAARYHVGAEELAKLNGIGRKYPLRRGATLTVPASLHSPPVVIDHDDPSVSTSYVPERNIAPLASLDGSSIAEGRSCTWSSARCAVRPARALWREVDVTDIVHWNHLKTSSVRHGMRLKIRTGLAADDDAGLAAADSAAIAGIKVPASRKHSRHSGGAAATSGGPSVVVQSGETLSQIAARHGVSVTELKRANGLSTTNIHAGQKLRLPSWAGRLSAVSPPSTTPPANVAV
jgi:membrane-bound lytic murein transglycosylase D